VLKELRLANEGTVAAQTAFHASCDTACFTISSPTGGNFATGRQGGNNGGSSSGGNPGSSGGHWKKKGRGSAQSGGGHRPSAPSAAPWYCYPPWAAEVQQQPWRPPAWGGPGVLRAFPSAQAHTALAPAQFSGTGTATPAPPPQQQGGWDQADLIAALNQMSLQGPSPGSSTPAPRLTCYPRMVYFCPVFPLLQVSQLAMAPSFPSPAVAHPYYLPLTLFFILTMFWLPPI